VVGQPVVQTEASEPADGEVHLRLAHQPTVMDDAEQKAGQHEPHRRFGIDGGTADPSLTRRRDVRRAPWPREEVPPDEASTEKQDCGVFNEV
jgi:hypothetical protein